MNVDYKAQTRFLLQPTGKGLAKAGIRKTEIPTKSEPSKNHFRFSNLQKIKKRNGFLRLKVRKSSTPGNFAPAFAKPMLCDGNFFVLLS